MKNKLKYMIAAVVAAATLSGCAKLWEQERIEIIPLPETEIPVAPDQWEPQVTEGASRVAAGGGEISRPK